MKDFAGLYFLRVFNFAIFLKLWKWLNKSPVKIINNKVHETLLNIMGAVTNFWSTYRNAKNKQTNKQTNKKLLPSNLLQMKLRLVSFPKPGIE